MVVYHLQLDTFTHYNIYLDPDRGIKPLSLFFHQHRSYVYRFLPFRCPLSLLTCLIGNNVVLQPVTQGQLPRTSNLQKTYNAISLLTSSSVSSCRLSPIFDVPIHVTDFVVARGSSAFSQHTRLTPSSLFFTHCPYLAPQTV